MSFLSGATVLVYHGIPDAPNLCGLRSDSVPLMAFEQQMTILRREKFSVIALEDLVTTIRDGKAVPDRTIVLTFDDGYVNFFRNAYPVLKALQLPSTVFVATDYVGGSFTWLKDGTSGGRDDRGAMNWSELKELKRENVEIGSHTSSHRFLPYLAREDIVQEFVASARVLRTHLGDVASLALPFSFPVIHTRWPLFKAAVLEGLQHARYESCCTMERGLVRTETNRLLMPRIPVVRDDTLLTFRLKALGLYALTTPAQRFYQRYLKKYAW